MMWCFSKTTTTQTRLNGEAPGQGIISFEYGEATPLLGPEPSHLLHDVPACSAESLQSCSWHRGRIRQRGLHKQANFAFVEAEPLQQPVTDDDDLPLDSGSLDKSPRPPKQPKLRQAITLSVHTEDSKPIDPDNLVPMFTIGSAYMLTKSGARLEHLPAACLPDHNMEWSQQCWGPRSLLGGKLVYWTSKTAALEHLEARQPVMSNLRERLEKQNLRLPFDRHRPNPQPVPDAGELQGSKGSLRRSQAWSHNSTDALAAEITPLPDQTQAANGKDVSRPGRVGSDPSDGSADNDWGMGAELDSEQQSMLSSLDQRDDLEAAPASEQNFASGVSNESIQYFRVWKVPEPRRKSWLGRGRSKDARRWEGKQTYDEVLQEQEDGEEDPKDSSSWRSPAFLLQCPLLFGLFKMRLNSKIKPLYTLCSSSQDVIAKNKGSVEKEKNSDVDLAVYSIPGLWMLCPSSKGFVHFEPHFLCKDQLMTVWEASRSMRVKSVLVKRKKKRERSALFIQRQVGKWAADRTGLNQPSAPPPAESGSENEPPELKALLQEMGMMQPTAAQTSPRNALLVPLKFVTVALCGAAVLGTEFLHMVENATDHAWFWSPLGRRSVLKSDARPCIQTKGLTEVLSIAKHHNKRAEALRRSQRGCSSLVSSTREQKGSNFLQATGSNSSSELSRSRSDALKQTSQDAEVEQSSDSPPDTGSSSGAKPIEHEGTSSARHVESPASSEALNHSKGENSNLKGRRADIRQDDDQAARAAESKRSPQDGEAAANGAQSKKSSADNASPLASNLERREPDSNDLPTKDRAAREERSNPNQSREQTGLGPGAAGLQGLQGPNGSRRSKPQPEAAASDSEPEYRKDGLISDEEEFLKLGLKLMQAAEQSFKRSVKSMTKSLLDTQAVVERLNKASGLGSVVRRCPTDGRLESDQQDSRFLPSLCQTATNLGLAALRACLLVTTVGSNMDFMPLPPAFQALKAPSGVHRWLLQIPRLSPGPTVIQNGDGITSIATLIQSPVSDHAIFNLDMNKVCGRDKKAEYVPQSVLRGIMIVGDLNLEKDEEIPLPRDLSVGISNAPSLIQDLADWP